MTSPRIKCPVILSAFKVGKDRAGGAVRFDFSVINLLDEFRYPSVPYYCHYIDDDVVRTLLGELDESIETTGNSRLQQYGRSLWNHALPRPIRDYLGILEQEHAIQLLLMTNDMRIPWEIVHDDSGFWALKYPMGRIYGMPQNTVGLARRGGKKRGHRPPVLLVCDAAGDLPGARAEGQVLSRRLQGAFDVRMRRGPVRTYDLDLEIGSNEYDIIHYAGHARMGKRSALVAADGYLLSDRIAEYSLARHPIVFANACSTAAGGYFGANSRTIAEAFIEAGAAAFVGALWRTGDQAAAAFASTMYSHVKSGSTIGDALLKARVSLFEQAGPSDTDWAAFALFGNPASRLYRRGTTDEAVVSQLELTMSNARGTLGHVLVAMSDIGVNIVQGRSVTLDDEETAGYVAEVEIPASLTEAELRHRLESSEAADLISGVRLVS